MQNLLLFLNHPTSQTEKAKRDIFWGKASSGRVDCNLPGSSVHGILQARTLEWTAIPFSRGSSWPRVQTQVSCMAGRFFTTWTTTCGLTSMLDSHLLTLVFIKVNIPGDGVALFCILIIVRELHTFSWFVFYAFFPGNSPNFILS